MNKKSESAPVLKCPTALRTTHCALFALLSALSGLIVIGCIDTYKLERPETRIHTATGINELNLASGNGALAVSATTETLITVNITRYCWGRDSTDASRYLNNITISDTVVGAAWCVAAQLPSGRRAYGAQFAAAAPARLRLRLATTNGRVTVSGMTGGIEASTSNGTVTLTGTEGAATVATTNSPVIVQVHRGPVTIATTNAEIDCDLAELGATDTATLRTSNGTVTLRLPADVAAVVDAQTSNGMITFTGFSTISYQLQEPTHQRVRIGSGAALVTITTTNGDISIRAR